MWSLSFSDKPETKDPKILKEMFIDEDGFEFEEVKAFELKPGDYIHHWICGSWRGALVSQGSLEHDIIEVGDGTEHILNVGTIVRRYPHACIDRDVKR